VAPVVTVPSPPAPPSTTRAVLSRAGAGGYATPSSPGRPWRRGSRRSRRGRPAPVPSRWHWRSPPSAGGQVLEFGAEAVIGLLGELGALCGVGHRSPNRPGGGLAADRASKKGYRAPGDPPSGTPWLTPRPTKVETGGLMRRHLQPRSHYSLGARTSARACSTVHFVGRFFISRNGCRHLQPARPRQARSTGGQTRQRDRPVGSAKTTTERTQQ